MTGAIHPSAVVEDGARLGAGVEIGPFCHVGSQAKLSDGVDRWTDANRSDRAFVVVDAFDHVIVERVGLGIHHDG